MQPGSTHGADAQEKMCGCETSTCGGKVLPSQIGLGGKVCFLSIGRRKTSRSRNFWAINSDYLLNDMTHESWCLQFLGYGAKKHV
jgi:hypothetical protein